MMNELELAEANIRNLTGLWRAMGEGDGFVVGDGLMGCGFKDSGWPNRVWFDDKVSGRGIVGAEKILRETGYEMKLSVWDYAGDGAVFEEVVGAGFRESFGQVGMVLELTKLFEEDGVMRVEEVIFGDGIRVWGDVFEGAFGYRISERLLNRGVEGVRLLLIYDGDVAVGTAMVYMGDAAVVGIHAMGVLPAGRGKGVAGRLMKYILNAAVLEGYAYAVLQASDMGKGLYAKLGFRDQFLMKNYVIGK